MFRNLRRSVNFTLGTQLSRRNISQINVKPPKYDTDVESKVNQWNTFFVIALNIACVAAMGTLIQTDEMQEKIATYFAPKEIQRRIAKTVESHHPEEVKRVKDLINQPNGFKLPEGSSLGVLAPVNKAEIVPVFSFPGTGYKTNLLAEAAEKDHILWFDGKGVTTSSQFLLKAIGAAGESATKTSTKSTSYVLKPNVVSLVFKDALIKAAEESPKGVVVVLANASEVSSLVETQVLEHIGDIAEAAYRSKKIRFVLLNPTPKQLTTAFKNCGSSQVTVKTFRGAQKADSDAWLTSKITNEADLFKPYLTAQQELQGKKLTMKQTVARRLMGDTSSLEGIAAVVSSTCGPDIGCSTNLIQAFQTATASSSSTSTSSAKPKAPEQIVGEKDREVTTTIQEAVLQAREPKVQLVQLMVLDLLTSSAVALTSPPDLISIQAEIIAKVAPQLVKILGKKSPDVTEDGVRKLVHAAFANLERAGVVWRCNADGNVQSDVSAPYVCIRQRRLGATWPRVRDGEGWVREMKEAALKSVKERK